MLHHISIVAEHPAHVADVLAKLWQCNAYRFPMYPNSYIAFAGDEYGTAIEVYPLGGALLPGRPDLPDLQIQSSPSPYTGTHIAMSVPLEVEAILAIAAQENWQARVGDRGPFFQVVEFWVENRVLLELLTPRMKQDYLAFTTPQNWQEKLLAAMPA